MIQKIKLGTAPNDKTGDSARLAGQKINENFIYLDNKISNKDIITTYGTYSLDGQNLTIHSGWVWQINGLSYSNPVNVIINYPYSSIGKIRLDKIVFNTSNTFTKLPGLESLSNPVAVPTPVGTIEFGVSLVTDAEIEEPIPPNPSANSPIPYLTLRLIAKGVGNSLVTEQPGDIFEGFKDATTYWTRAKWNGGNRGNRNNYTPIVENEL